MLKWRAVPVPPNTLQIGGENAGLPYPTVQTANGDCARARAPAAAAAKRLDSLVFGLLTQAQRRKEPRMKTAVVVVVAAAAAVVVAAAAVCAAPAVTKHPAART